RPADGPAPGRHLVDVRGAAGRTSFCSPDMPACGNFFPASGVPSGRRGDSRFMAFIDSAVLDLPEWACRKFQALTGRTNIWLAVQLTNLSIIVYFVGAAAYFITS